MATFAQSLHFWGTVWKSWFFPANTNTFIHRLISTASTIHLMQFLFRINRARPTADLSHSTNSTSRLIFNIYLVFSASFLFICFSLIFFPTLMNLSLFFSFCVITLFLVVLASGMVTSISKAGYRRFGVYFFPYVARYGLPIWKHQSRVKAPRTGRSLESGGTQGHISCCY